MKNNIIIAALAIAFIAPAQVFAQAKEGQTPEQQIQEVITIIKSEIADSFPEYQETTKWDLSKDRQSQEVHGGVAINLGEDAQYLWFSNNADNVFKAILDDIKGGLSQEFVFDLYQIGYVGEGDGLSLVLFLDYQNPVTNLEELQKAALEGTGLTPSDLNK
jgi:hypothetical protein